MVEADEYDTAFFDKRAKFVHYRPNIAILNNLEFDHADIYDDIKAIQTQFHHLVRTIPGNGTIVSNGRDARLEAVLERGCWSHLQRFSEEEDADWRVDLLKPDGSRTGVFPCRPVIWASCAGANCGRHNALNACAALAAGVAAGVDPKTALSARSAASGASSGAWS